MKEKKTKSFSFSVLKKIALRNDILSRMWRLRPGANLAFTAKSHYWLSTCSQRKINWKTFPILNPSFHFVFFPSSLLPGLQSLWTTGFCSSDLQHHLSEIPFYSPTRRTQPTTSQSSDQLLPIDSPISSDKGEFDKIMKFNELFVCSRLSVVQWNNNWLPTTIDCVRHCVMLCQIGATLLLMMTEQINNEAENFARFFSSKHIETVIIV